MSSTVMMPNRVSLIATLILLVNSIGDVLSAAYSTSCVNLRNFIVFNDGDVDHAEPVSLKMLQINNNATRSEKPVARKTQCIQNSHPKFNAHQAKIIQPVAAQLPICIADRD